MPRLNSLFSVFLFASALFAFACSTVSVDVVPTGNGGDACSHLELSAFMEAPAGKAILDLPHVLWEDNDCIAVFDGTARRMFTIPEGGNHGSSATFVGDASSGAADLYAAYPESTAEACANGLLTVVVPSVQHVPEGRSSDPDALVAVAHAQAGKLQFHNVPSLLRINIQSSGISCILLRGQYLSGKVQADSDGNVSGHVATCDYVKLLPSGDTFAPGTYYAAVLPGKVAADSFSISLIRNDVLSYTRTSHSENVFQRSVVIDAGTLDSSASWSKVIFTREQLFAWNAMRDDADASEKVSLGADIDMEGVAWTARDFAGSFDGQGHKIWNFKTESSGYTGFLREMKNGAALKNLVLGSSDGVNPDGTSVIRHSSSSDNYTWYYAGVVAKASGSSSISGVTNYATVEVAANSTAKTRIGGIVGNWNSTGTIQYCSNYGAVRNLASVTGQKSGSDTTVEPSIVGGVIGFLDLRSSISHCSNYGQVSSSNPAVSAIGGVIGYDGRGSRISACYNGGSVIQEASSISTDCSVAGVLGYALGASGTYGYISGCINEAAVSAKGNGKVMRIAGITGYTDYYTVESCTNRGKVCFSNTSATSGYIAIGGVVSHTYHGCVVQGCRNEGAVSSDKPQVNRVGGVVGNLNASSISDCVNSGTVTLSLSAREIDNWEGIGGIVGFSEGDTGNRAVTGCTNEPGGVVSAVVKTNGRSDYQRCAAGGIIGMPFTTMTLSRNINKAAVSLKNLHSSAPYAYAGGIVGQDSGAKSASYITENINYGSVQLISGKSGYCGAGGLFGNIANASQISGNCNFGDVSGTVAGAAAGVNTLSFSVTVCDALAVNGTAYAGAADKQAWASPQSSGTITLDVRHHSDDETGSTVDLPAPLDPGNKVVAHRGGSTESGYPDNSRRGLRYAMALGCYASECDIYWTKDNKVIVAHANSEDKINGLHPWEATASEIIAAGRLSNSETIPTLEEFLDIVMESGSKTKLLLDIKMIDTPSNDYDHPAKAALRALEIIQEKRAQNYVEFICTSYEQVMQKVAPSMKAAGIPCGWMCGSVTAATFKNKGYTDWANLNAREHFKGIEGSYYNRTIAEFKNAGLKLSIFHVDKKSGNSSAVYSEAEVKMFLDEYDYLRCITTNYPSWLLSKTANL